MRTALITGATSDLGVAIVEAMEAAGHAIVASARPGPRLDALATVGRRTLPLDLRDPLATFQVASGLEVDVLVHAATGHPPTATARTFLPDDGGAWAVTVGALRALASAVTPGMAARGWGRVIAIGSSAGGLGGPGAYGYAAAKAGLVGATRTLAAELGRKGVTANVVVPGLLATSRTASATSTEAQDWLVRQTAVGRLGAPSEVAALVRWLASDEAGFVTGATWAIDGGLGLAAGLPGRPR